MYQALKTYTSVPSALGPLADRLAGATKTMLAVNETVKPMYTTPTPISGGGIDAQLTLAARLFNAHLGVRVISTAQGDYDTHADEPGRQGGNLKDLDGALRIFFTTLKPAVRARTVVMTFSEFGRKAHANDSAGTDHGRASNMLVIGERVRGGMYGAHPSFEGLDTWDDAEPTVDFRSVYTSILKTWLGANPVAVIGGSFPRLSLFRTGPA